MNREGIYHGEGAGQLTVDARKGGEVAVRTKRELKEQNRGYFISLCMI